MSRKTAEPIDYEAAHRKAMALLANARREGTHSDRSLHLCTGCYQWVDGIYHVEGRKELCERCADAAGHGPKQFRERQARNKSGARP